jgi:hypothetical protein
MQELNKAKVRHYWKGGEVIVLPTSCYWSFAPALLLQEPFTMLCALLCTLCALLCTLCALLCTLSALLCTLSALLCLLQLLHQEDLSLRWRRITQPERCAIEDQAHHNDRRTYERCSVSGTRSDMAERHAETESEENAQLSHFPRVLLLPFPSLPFPSVPEK